MTRGSMQQLGEVRQRQLPGSGVCKLDKVSSSSLAVWGGSGWASVGRGTGQGQWVGAMGLLSLINLHSAVKQRKEQRDAVSDNCQYLGENILVLVTVNLPCQHDKSFQSPEDRHLHTPLCVSKRVVQSLTKGELTEGGSALHECEQNCPIGWGLRWN